MSLRYNISEPNVSIYSLKGAYIMTTSKKMYNLSDIYVGMKIQDRSQLDNIFDTWIILYKESKEEDYTIGFIGKHTTMESDNLLKDYITCPIYNDSINSTEDIYCEESLH